MKVNASAGSIPLNTPLKNTTVGQVQPLSNKTFPGWTPPTPPTQNTTPDTTNNNQPISTQIADMNSSDAAQTLTNLSSGEASSILSTLDSNTANGILSQLSPEVAQSIISQMPTGWHLPQNAIQSNPFQSSLQPEQAN